MTNNPYVLQIMQQTGMTESEVRKSSRPAVITLETAQSHGYDSVSDYEDALHDFLNGQ